MTLRVLIVDDNVEFLLTARHLLERQGVEVVGVASTGAEALRSTAQQTPDVVLVDVNLGGENGFDLAERLSAAKLGHPVILISTHAEDDLQDLVETSSAIGFVSKLQLSAQAIIDVLDHGDRDGTMPWS